MYAILFSAVQSTVLQRLYVKPRMSSSKCKSRGDGAVATVLFKVLYCNIKNVFSIYCSCEKYYKHITVRYYIADFVSWVSRLTLLDLTNKSDLRRCSRNGTRSYVGDFMCFCLSIIALIHMLLSSVIITIVTSQGSLSLYCPPLPLNHLYITTRTIFPEYKSITGHVALTESL